MRALRTTELRVAWLRATLRAHAAAEAAAILEEICAAAERAEQDAEATLHALVELAAAADFAEARDALRAAARADRHLALERILRRPYVARPSTSALRAPASLDDDLEIAIDAPADRPQRGVPDYGRGRPLTLGERKSLARRPPAELLPKLLADPHPDVIRNLLSTPRLTEEEVVRVATRRPGRSEVLAEIARHPRWCQRARVRFSLVMNPATPPETAIAMVALLLRRELREVASQAALHPAVRAAALERLQRRPPIPPASSGSVQ